MAMGADIPLRLCTPSRSLPHNSSPFEATRNGATSGYRAEITFEIGQELVESILKERDRMRLTHDKMK